MHEFDHAPEIRQLASALLKMRRFPATTDLPTWQHNWPDLTIEGWAWGEGGEGCQSLDLHVLLGGHEVAVCGDGGLWQRTGADVSLDEFELVAHFSWLPDSDLVGIVLALENMAMKLDKAVELVTHELLAEVRCLGVRWLAGALISR